MSTTSLSHLHVGDVIEADSSLVFIGRTDTYLRQYFKDASTPNFEVFGAHTLADVPGSKLYEVVGIDSYHTRRIRQIGPDGKGVEAAQEAFLSHGDVRQVNVVGKMERIFVPAPATPK
jgi:hypothetical protein